MAGLPYSLATMDGIRQRAASSYPTTRIGRAESTFMRAVIR
jgi:hypothetical protein